MDSESQPGVEELVRAKGLEELEAFWALLCENVVGNKNYNLYNMLAHSLNERYRDVIAILD